MLVSQKGVGRSWHRPRFSHRRGRRRIRVGRLGSLLGLWIALVVVGIVLSASFLWFPIYYWYLPGIVALVVGIFGGMRVWRYATGVHNVQSAWTRRIVMSAGLLGSGFLIFILYFSTLMADLVILYSSPFATQSSVVNQAANMATGFMMTVIAFIVPIFFAFMIGEGYLLYRLRHHYTVSGF